METAVLSVSRTRGGEPVKLPHQRLFLFVISCLPACRHPG
ncbi:hypothetical protein AMB3_3443 [plant metagenome]